MDNNRFQEIKTKHPDWSDEQIWTAVSLDMQTDNVIEQRGDDVSMNDPDIVEYIIRGAMQWLEDVLPIVFEKVRVYLNKLLQNIGEWVRKGIDYIIEYLATCF